MRATKAQASRTRIVDTASMLFRERGFDGVGVAELMAAAGMTPSSICRGSTVTLGAAAARLLH